MADLASAGLRVGDVFVKINGEAPFSAPLGTFAGKEIMLIVNRDGKDVEMSMKVGSREFTGFGFFEINGATPKQLKIREGLVEAII